jgi:hypothetical protein
MDERELAHLKIEMERLARIAKRPFNSYVDPRREIYDMSVIGKRRRVELQERPYTS